MNPQTIGILKNETSTDQEKSLLGCILQARELGYETIASDNLEILDPSRLRGLIYLQRRDIDTPLLKRLEKNGLPIVACNTIYPEIASVAPDNYGGIRTALRHLHSLGHKRIAFVRGPTGNRNAEERLDAYRTSLEDLDLDFDASLIAQGGKTVYSARNASYQLLSARRDFTAILCNTDKAAIGAIGAIRQSGLKTPEDIAVVGFSNFAEALSMTDDLITTVDHPTYQIGIESVEILHRKISGENISELETRVPCELHLRTTCGGDIFKIPKPRDLDNEEDRLLGYLFSVGDHIGGAYISELIELYRRKISDGEHPISALRTIFVSGINNGLDPSIFHNLLIQVGKKFEYWSRQSQSRPTSTQVLSALQKLCRNSIIFYNRHALNVEQRFTEVTESVFNLKSDISKPDSVAIMMQQLQIGLKAESISLLLFDNPSLTFGSQNGPATLWQSGSSISAKERSFHFNAQEFQYNDILPPGRCYSSFNAITLKSQEGVTGILFIDTDTTYLHLYHKLGPLLAANIQRASLFNSLQDQARRLETQKEALESAKASAEKAKIQESKARRQAEEANNAKSDFLTVMSHEIRTPLNCIIGMADIANTTDEENETKECIRVVRDSANTLLEIVNDLLDFTKIEKGQLKLRYARFSIKTEMGSMLEMLRPNAEEKDLYLKIKTDTALPSHVAGDPIRLKQILGNLIENAIRFTEKGGVTLQISLAEIDPARPEIEFKVKDTGVGINAETRRQLSDTINNSPGADHDLYSGIGLGLAIVGRLAKQMDGTITIESRPGRGSSFSLRLPLSELPAQEPAPSEPSSHTIARHAPADEPQAANQHNRNILLVDDNTSNLLVAQTLLEHDGHTVTTATDGRKAIELWEKDNYDLILLDVQMPGLNGWETTGEIREAEAKRGIHTYIIALTSHAIEGFDKKCYAAGMDAYISKPIDREKLRKLVRESPAVQQDSSHPASSTP